MVDQRFKRGARRAPRHKLLATEPFKPKGAPPAQFAIVPKHLDMWGNDQYGDCVSAEEAFAKATAAVNPQCFIDADTVVNWAQQYGFRDGADLPEVMDAMARNGFHSSGHVYGDGSYKGVDYSNEQVLQAALCVGPVKIAIDANALPDGAGNKQGWYSFKKGNFPNTDHCVALTGYGPAAFLFGQLGATVPPDAPAGTLYLLYTWNTIGVVSHDWLMGTCTEAYVRQPTSTDNGSAMPQTDPNPNPNPNPPPPPPPGPSPGPSPLPWWMTLLEVLPALVPILLQILQLFLKAVDEFRREQKRVTSGGQSPPADQQQK